MSARSVASDWQSAKNCNVIGRRAACLGSTVSHRHRWGLERAESQPGLSFVIRMQFFASCMLLRDLFVTGLLDTAAKTRKDTACRVF
jgi:hypothetical protein